MMKPILLATTLAACGTVTAPPAQTFGSGAPDAGSGVSTTDAGSGSAVTDAGSGSGSGSGSGTIASAGTFTIDPTGFYDDGTDWWTTSSGPAVTGTVQTSGGTLQAFVGGQLLASAGITGTSWSMTLPSGTVAATGTRITFELSAPGAQSVEHDQLLALDSGAPALSVTAPFHDERGDTISFAGGDAQHTHAGASVDLAAGCPDVYKYAYLTDTTPMHVTESSPNPIAWQVMAMSPVGIDSTEYRVRTATTTALDWAPVTAGAIVLHRDALPQLGSYEGDIYVDVDVKDHLGVATQQTYCMHYHPMAAPLEIQPIAKETAASPLWPMQLPNHDSVSLLLMSGVAMYGQRFVQHASDPVTLDITLDQPTATYAKTVADHYLKLWMGTYNCGFGGGSTDPHCKMPTIPASTTLSYGGTATTGTWSIQVIDEVTGGATCTINGLQATCTIPARAAGEAAHPYRIVSSVQGMTDVAPCPQAGSWGEETLSPQGNQYTGTPSATIYHCDSKTYDQAGNTICNWTSYTHYCGLAAAKVSFDPFVIHFATSVNASVPERTTTFTSSAMTWDGGTVGLP